MASPGNREQDLNSLMDAIQPERVVGRLQGPVRGIACHPGDVRGPGYVFVCMDEFLEYNRWQTWRTHLEILPGLGLSAVVVPEEIPGLEVPQCLLNPTRPALGRLARRFYGEPDRALDLFGVTGTNGKTTTTRILAHLLNRLGRRCASLGTLGAELEGEAFVSGHYTTPPATEIFRHLAAFRAAGARAAAMEVSSHALALDRVEGLSFDGVILTNLERDHLDFHGTRDAYAEAKGRLFERLRAGGQAICHVRCDYLERYRGLAPVPIKTFGPPGSAADYTLEDPELEARGSAFSVRHGKVVVRVHTQLAGTFQLENILAAMALLHAGGIEMEALAEAVASFPPVPGRMEQIVLPGRVTAIVDYAHNPDGLENLLRACSALCKGRLHVVFGCGGDRDQGKRPLMGGIAARYADVLWVTSDNPRTEDPQRILDHLFEGIPADTTAAHRIVDRREAIEAACASASSGDLVVVAGKGHEDYQIIGHERLPFSDQEVLRSLAASAS